MTQYLDPILYRPRFDKYIFSIRNDRHANQIVGSFNANGVVGEYVARIRTGEPPIAAYERLRHGLRLCISRALRDPESMETEAVCQVRIAAKPH